MLTLLMYAICLLVIVEGARALQFAIAAAEPVKSWRGWVLAIGVMTFVGAVVIALALANQFAIQAENVGKALEPLMR